VHIAAAVGIGYWSTHVNPEGLEKLFFWALCLILAFPSLFLLASAMESLAQWILLSEDGSPAGRTLLLVSIALLPFVLHELSGYEWQTARNIIPSYWNTERGFRTGFATAEEKGLTDPKRCYDMKPDSAVRGCLHFLELDGPRP